MSESDRALVRALQLAPDVDLVAQFGDDQAWERLKANAGPFFEPDFQCAVLGTRKAISLPAVSTACASSGASG